MELFLGSAGSLHSKSFPFGGRGEKKNPLCSLCKLLLTFPHNCFLSAPALTVFTSRLSYPMGWAEIHKTFAWVQGRTLPGRTAPFLHCWGIQAPKARSCLHQRVSAPPPPSKYRSPQPPTPVIVLHPPQNTGPLHQRSSPLHPEPLSPSECKALCRAHSGCLAWESSPPPSTTAAGNEVEDTGFSPSPSRLPAVLS